MSNERTTDEESAYFVEPEQLVELRAINKALYGDGTQITPDRRRDLANRLDMLLSRVAQQTFSLEQVVA